MQDSNNTEDRIKGELSNAETRATKPPDGNGKAISLSPFQDDEGEGNLDGPVSEGLPGYILTFHFSILYAWLFRSTIILLAYYQCYQFKCLTYSI